MVQCCTCNMGWFVFVYVKDGIEMGCLRGRRRRSAERERERERERGRLVLSGVDGMVGGGAQCLRLSREILESLSE